MRYMCILSKKHRDRLVRVGTGDGGTFSKGLMVLNWIELITVTDIRTSESQLLIQHL